MQNGTVIDTKDGMHYAALAAEKGRVTLESKGLKGRGGSARIRMARYFKMSTRSSHDAVIARIQQEMDAIIAAKSH